MKFEIRNLKLYPNIKFITFITADASRSIKMVPRKKAIKMAPKSNNLRDLTNAGNITFGSLDKIWGSIRVEHQCPKFEDHYKASLNDHHGSQMEKLVIIQKIISSLKAMNGQFIIKSRETSA